MVNKNNIGVILVLITAFVVVIFAHNRFTGSDPRATLLVTESLLTRGTIKLDHYGDDLPERYGYVIQKKNDHLYYYFPIGTSIASLPFVAVAKVFGLEMTTKEYVVQIITAAITSVLTLFVLIRLAGLFLNPTNALLAGSVFWFGTSLASTAGTALWSHNFATLFALLAVYLVIRATKLGEQRNWPFIAVLLFSAYLCRPTMALLSPFVLLYLFTYHKVTALKTGFLVAALLGVFALFSMHEFGQLLPDYYLPKRLAGGHFYEALYGNLLSPSRGLFIYSPFILTAWLCVKYSKKEWGLKASWLLIGLAWPILHLISISRFPHWWAGYSYGPRFMTDVLPGLFLLTLYTWPTEIRDVKSKVLASILGVACVFAIAVHSGQGLFNHYTAIWNSDPPLEKNQEYLFDWSYPQFLANQKGHRKRLLENAMSHLKNINPNEIIDHLSDRVLFLYWNASEPTHRWSSDRKSSIIFLVDPTHEQFTGTIQLHAGSSGNQPVAILLNGTEIYSGTLRSWDENITINFQPQLLVSGENLLEFKLPDAVRQRQGNREILAVALKSFQIK